MRSCSSGTLRQSHFSIQLTSSPWACDSVERRWSVFAQPRQHGAADEIELLLYAAALDWRVSRLW